MVDLSSFRVTGANNASKQYSVTKWNEFLAALEAALTPPTNTSLPVIAGGTDIGDTLTCSEGTWEGSPTLSYQWRRSGSNITGATSSTHIVVSGDAGAAIDCVVTAINGGGTISATAEAVTIPSSSLEWEGNANLPAVSESDGWYYMEKNGGGTDFTSALGHTTTALSGDFTLYVSQPSLPGEILVGLNDTQTGAYTTYEQGVDVLNGLVFSFSSGFSSVLEHRSHTLSEYVVLQRLGNTVSLYITDNLSALGLALRTWTQAGDLYGQIIISADGVAARVKMVSGTGSPAQPGIPASFEDSRTSDNETTHIETSPFARVVYDTDATRLTVNTWNDIYGAYPEFTQIGLIVDGVHQSIAPSGAGARSNEITLMAGTKRIEFVNGLQSSGPAGTYFVSVVADADLTRVTPTANPRILFYGDSITVGDSSDTPTAEAYPMVVRAATADYRIGVEATGGRSLHDDCVDGTARADFVSKIEDWNPSILWLAIGTNDYGLNLWTAANFGTAYAALLDDLHAALPSLQIYCQTPLARSSEVANGLGSTLPNYRAQIATEVSTRTAYCTLVDGTAILTTDDLDDGLHPTTAGHALYGAAVIDELGL